MDNLKVVPISTKLEDSRAISVEDSLKDAIKDIQNGDRDPSDSIVLLLNRKDNKYEIRWYLSGLSCSEAVALLSYSKARIF